jgi:hypothetical protein
VNKATGQAIRTQIGKRNNKKSAFSVGINKGKEEKEGVLANKAPTYLSVPRK